MDHLHGKETAYLVSIFIKLESRHALDLAIFTHILGGGEINIKRMELITLEINNKKVHHPNI